MRIDRPWSRRDFISGSCGAIAAGALGCGGTLVGADLILYGGEVFTGQLGRPRAEAVAVRDGSIVAVGSLDEIRRYQSATTRVIDASNRTVLPGINDSHLHGLGWGLNGPPFSLDVTSRTVTSIADVAAAVRDAAAARGPGEWIQGRGWDEPYLAEGRPPTRYDLDLVAPENPVILTEFSGHTVWVNSRALREAGIDRNTLAPAGGVIVRDEAGEPTGLLRESASGLIRRVVPPNSEDTLRQAIQVATERMLALGITSFTDPGIDLATLAVYADLARSNELPVRTTVLLRAGSSVVGLERLLDARDLLTDVDPDVLQLAGIKIFADGIPTGNKTAWLHEPYVGGGNGALGFDGEDDAARINELKSMVRIVHEAGLQIGTHVTGDRAIDEVVNAYAEAMGAHPRPDPRHYLIHADLVSPPTLARMSALGIGANFNASIKYLIADGQRNSIGDERASYEWPYHTALEAGVVVASSSDAPVTDGNWRQGVATAVLREGQQSGAVSGPDQAISLDDALRSYTWAGAWQDRSEEFKGTIEPGKAADLCVIDARLSELDLHDLPMTDVVLAMVSGRVAYEADPMLRGTMTARTRMTAREQSR